MENWRAILISGLCVLWLWSPSLRAQDRIADSLKQVLHTCPMDTHRVNVLNLLVGRIKVTDYAQALDLLNESIRLADSLGYKPGLAEGKVSYAELQNNLGAYERSMLYGTEAYQIFEQLPDSQGMGRALMCIGLVQNALKSHAKGIASLQKAVTCYRSAHDLRGEISAQHNLAVIYVASGDTLAGKNMYLDNLRLLQDTKFWHIFAGTYNNLGNLFDPIKEGDSAISYFEKSLEYKFLAPVPNKGQIGNSLMNIAGIHYARSEYLLAEQRLNKAKPYVVASQEKPRLMEMWHLQGQICYKLGRYKESAEAFEQQTIIQDSLYTPRMTEQAARLEAAFESENQKKEIELLNQAKELESVSRARWQWITAFVVIGLALTIAFLIVVVMRGRERSRMLRRIQQNEQEIKRQQQEIMLQNEALSIQNKRLADVNHEKDALIGVVAHDIRAPLHRSSALAALVESLGNLNPEQLRYLQMIKKVNDDGGRLIQDLLELNSYEQNGHQINLQAVDLKLVLEHSMHGFVADAGQKNIAIHLDAASTQANTDEKLLGRILDNLISNAVKFTPKGKQVFLSLETDADRHWIIIRDEGPGINRNDQAKMFQKFQRLTARPTGGESSTGLGLSIVHTLANRIGAELAFSSELGVGTTFKLGIPKETSSGR